MSVGCPVSAGSIHRFGSSEEPVIKQERKQIPMMNKKTILHPGLDVHKETQRGAARSAFHFFGWFDPPKLRRSAIFIETRGPSLFLFFGGVTRAIAKIPAPIVAPPKNKKRNGIIHFYKYGTPTEF